MIFGVIFKQCATYRRPFFKVGRKVEIILKLSLMTSWFVYIMCKKREGCIRERSSVLDGGWKTFVDSSLFRQGWLLLYAVPWYKGQLGKAKNHQKVVIFRSKEGLKPAAKCTGFNQPKEQPRQLTVDLVAEASMVLHRIQNVFFSISLKMVLTRVSSEVVLASQAP